MGWSLTFNENKSSRPELSGPPVNKKHGKWKEKCNVFQEECTQALWVAVCSGPGRKCLHRISVQNCRSTGKVSAASPTLTLTLCILSELRCLKKSLDKRLSQERYVINGKHHQVSQACTKILATQPIQRFLFALKKEPLLRHLTSQMVHAKYSTESRAMPFESGVHTKLMTYLKTPCTSHNSFDMAPFRLSHTQRHTVDQVLNMHYTKRNCRHVTHLDSLQKISDENCMRGQMGEQLDHGQQLEHQERKQNILVAGLLCGCSWSVKFRSLARFVLLH